jgi:hypothetical protein
MQAFLSFLLCVQQTLPTQTQTCNKMLQNRVRMIVWAYFLECLKQIFVWNRKYSQRKSVTKITSKTIRLFCDGRCSERRCRRHNSSGTLRHVLCWTVTDVSKERMPISSGSWRDFVCLFVWGPVSGCTAACRLIVCTPCVFNVPTFTARRLHVTTTLEILAAKCGTCWARNVR